MNRPSQRTIFLEALDQDDPQGRETYLRSACGDDVELRSAVDALLLAHDRPENPLDRPVLPNQLAETLVTDQTPISDHLGLTIGPYRLMEQIGEGGFGLVFVAQQEKPVRRKVALKIIKPGTASREILARFDAERQAVAMMDHPNIARVFDAGVTDDARPYFVMELVKGQPITEFCDQHALPLRKRMELFRDVCAATQHAHQKGVIHRDLKPSNVMVALHDDKPVVKVIDFGVAKAIGQDLTDQTLYTRFYSMIGTPLYMSPEQAAMSGLDVDTRSDIYSLGVLLYELLTGTTPFDRGRLDTAGYDEMRRIIREEEPPRPSHRLTTIQSSSSLTAVDVRPMAADLTSARREAIPNDLDWIVMKALEKDRTRRYESSSAMSDDVRRFLESEPIEARPPSNAYRLRKFAARNRTVLVTAMLVALALLVGTGASLYQASRAVAERDEKEVALNDAIEARNEIIQFADHLKTANLLLGESRAYEVANEYSAADAKLGQAIELVPNYYLVWLQRALMRADLGLWEEAAKDFSEAMRLEAPVDSRQWEGAAAVFYLTDRPEDYEELCARLVKTHVNDEAPLPLNTLRSLLISPTHSSDARQWAADGERLVAMAQGPGRFGRRFGDREPARSSPDRSSPDRSSPDRSSPDHSPLEGSPPEGPERSGLGAPDLGAATFNPPEFDSPQFRGPEGRGPGPRDLRNPRGPNQGPRFLDLAPPSIVQYVAAWASLRAENPQRALELLDMAAQARGPSAEMLHSLRALAYHQLGDDSQSKLELARADESLSKMIDAFTSSTNPGPWFDFVEVVILHREATQAITGTKIETDPAIRRFQQQTRESLGLAR
ncbi:Serine/threonine-protein kinase PknB [Rubripirellula amarantea]|uniref:Serine/threonine-protein kinase PknB n=1 Tax=Rubripirellula amarantea TaxID=2527999 RepID=A0A5C5WXJ0_9BACT|nr:serine/threonine-protein kinase [Rubripirellula amarantea]TWT54841.1 Serine/threonine-protein kinase PknB [Rubripirellula amarantea]